MSIMMWPNHKKNARGIRSCSDGCDVSNIQLSKGIRNTRNFSNMTTLRAGLMVIDYKSSLSRREELDFLKSHMFCRAAELRIDMQIDPIVRIDENDVIALYRCLHRCKPIGPQFCSLPTDWNRIIMKQHAWECACRSQHLQRTISPCNSARQLVEQFRVNLSPTAWLRKIVRMPTIGVMVLVRMQPPTNC